MNKLTKKLLGWYAVARRDLPWRRTRDPYRIWVSEVMLQQTRVAAVIPYYERFLERFPSIEDLAGASEQELLRMWAGLGYYSRARNLREAARTAAGMGGFPRTYEEIRALPGVGDYTAAAVASIAFDMPVAAVDGNVVRVMARLTGETGSTGSAKVRERLRDSAHGLLDPERPGEFNQALMELGATLCLPREPLCPACPWGRDCQARRSGLERRLPVRKTRPRRVEEQKAVVVVLDRGRLLLKQRPAGSRRLAGFWELPEAGQFSGIRLGRLAGRFRHSITVYDYVYTVWEGCYRAGKHMPAGWEWVSGKRLAAIPLATVTRKALHVHRGFASP